MPDTLTKTATRLSAWAETRPARLLLCILLLVLASNWSTTPVGLVALLISVGLAYLNRGLGLALLFGSVFLPYVFGFPITAGFVVILLLAPVALFRLPSLIQQIPVQLGVLLVILFALICATYPFQRSVDLEFLAFGLVALTLAFLFVRGRPIPDVGRDLAIGYCAAFLAPFVLNMLLIDASPFHLERHDRMLFVGRITVSLIEPNVGAAYLLAGLVALVLGCRLVGTSGWLHGAVVGLGAVFMLCLAASGSRMTLLLALVFLGACLIGSYMFLKSEAFCRRSVRLISVSVLLISLFGGSMIAANGSVAGIERLVSTGSIEETGRPKTLRDSVERLDKTPWTGWHVQEYVLRTARHSPHSSVIAAVLFLGILVAIPYFALILFPVLDPLLGFRMGRFPLVAVVVVTLFLSMQAIPAATDRGMLILAGVWFASSRLPQMRLRASIRKESYA